MKALLIKIVLNKYFLKTLNIGIILALYVIFNTIHYQQKNYTECIMIPICLNLKKYRIFKRWAFTVIILIISISVPYE